jgi:sodium transport system ATP-binding protein
MIRVANLKKHFNGVKAVDGIDLEALDGKITGLLGPNGAGKTTTLRMIAGLIRPQAGNIVIDGIDVGQKPQAARAVLGVQGDTTGVYPRLTPREQFRYYGRFYGLNGPTLEARVQSVIDLLQMSDIADRRAEGFSRGQRQKVVLGRALIHDPHNMIMDEPTNGLDVMAVRETRATIRAFKEQGRCVLFSTHYMDEAERLCDHIAIIVAGKIVAYGSPAELKARTGRENLEDAFVELAGHGLELSAAARQDT